MSTARERPGVLDHGPISASARRLVDEAGALGTTPASSTLRAWTVARLFAVMDEVFALDADPVPLLNDAYAAVADALAAVRIAGLCPASADDHESSASDPAQVTADHYGRLFAGFSPQSYFDEPARLLATRVDRNAIDRTRFEGGSLLDAGCGGGRYSVAWKRLGAGRVTGVDFSETGIRDASARVAAAQIHDVTFVHGSVLELPFGNDAFDAVFSNGVLHHTPDPGRGLDELLRVLRPGGLGWLYLIERPGGLFWDTVDLLREVMRAESHVVAREALRASALPANRIFYVLDHVMVPINLRLTAEEVQLLLERAGAGEVRRLTRGVDFDRVEAFHRGDPYAEIKYGVGEHRYVFSK